MSLCGDVPNVSTSQRFLFVFVDTFLPRGNANIVPFRSCTMVEVPQSLKDLMEKQKQIEDELQTLNDFLCQPGMPGLHSKLVDEQGFPRADIDIYAVRGARHRIACLKTDYREVRTQIEKSLHDLHGRGAVRVKRAAPAAAGPVLDEEELKRALRECPYSPFATIDELHERSPAATGGLRLGDLVLRVGPLSIPNVKRKDDNVTEESSRVKTSDKPESDTEVEEQPTEARVALIQQVFQRLQDLVKNSVGREVDVDVFRSGKIVQCKLTPQTWEGKGLLGCRFTPLAHAI
eukprot:XP_028356049.1 26S proteasome non-ATPase regulatory subunit 9-like isoform X1 [Physeter catodon]